jgi:hypothetical protein
LLGFTSYLRPRELSSLLVFQLVPPCLSAGKEFGQWMLLLHPENCFVKSKTGFFDEHVALDSPITAWCPPFWKALVSGRDKQAPLWPFSHAELLRSFQAACRRSGVDVLSPTSYGLRHGGASHDALLGLRRLLEIKDRGRWASEASLRRYRKASRAQLEVHRMHKDTQELGRLAADNLEHFFTFPAEAKLATAALRLRSSMAP